MSLIRVPNSPKIRAFIGSNIASLGAGTPYLYSYYAPQLIERCHMPISKSSGLSLSLNIGSSLLGFVAGIIVDKNPRVACLIGSIGTFVAYNVLGYCYENEISNFFLLSLSLTLIGFGSVCGLYSAVTCCTRNFPQFRGTAGAFPVSLYALSGLLFSNLCPTFFGTAIRTAFTFLSITCSLMILVGSFTIKIIKQHPHENDSEYELVAHQSPSTPKANRYSFDKPNEPSTPIFQPSLSKFTSPTDSLLSPRTTIDQLLEQSSTTHQQWSTFDSTSPTGLPEDEINHEYHQQQEQKPKSNPVLITLKKPRFYVYFFILATLQGIGQMYIYSVGYIVQTNINSINLEQTTTNSDRIQSIQVSILSIMSFTGRLLSGPTSDFLVKKFHCQRLWNIVFCSFLTAYAAYKIQSGEQNSDPTISSNFSSSNMSKISFCSSIFGFAFGVMFGSFPSIIAEAFGSEGFSTIWGLSTSGGILTVKFFASLLGNELFEKSDNSTGTCNSGASCYSNTFTVIKYIALIITGTALALISNIYLRNKKTSNVH